MDQWTNGPMDQWTKGPMDKGTNGPMDQWIKGSRDQGTKGTMDKKLLRPYEKKNPWNIGTFDIQLASCDTNCIDIV